MPRIQPEAGEEPRRGRFVDVRWVLTQEAVDGGRRHVPPLRIGSAGFDESDLLWAGVPEQHVDLVRVAAGKPLPSSTGGRAFHIVTVVDGNVELTSGEERVTLESFETAIVSGAAGDYTVSAAGGSARLLRASPA